MRCLPTEEEAKARDKIDQAIRDRMYEEETGMPAISQWVQPADAAARQSNGGDPPVPVYDGPPIDGPQDAPPITAPVITRREFDDLQNGEGVN